MSEFVVALSTVPADFDAAALADALVTSGAAACVNILPPMESVYVWNGALQRERERQLVMKTTRARVGLLWTTLKARHPYDVPEFLVVPILEGNPDYLKWIEDTVNRKSENG